MSPKAGSHQPKREAADLGLLFKKHRILAIRNVALKEKGAGVKTRFFHVKNRAMSYLLWHTESGLHE